MSNCLFEATFQEVEKVCNCTLKYFVDISEGYEACEGKQRKCMNQLMVEMGDKREVVDRGRVMVSVELPRNPQKCKKDQIKVKFSLKCSQTSKIS